MKFVHCVCHNDSKGLLMLSGICCLPSTNYSVKVPVCNQNSFFKRDKMGTLVFPSIVKCCKLVGGGLATTNLTPNSNIWY